MVPEERTSNKLYYVPI